MINFNNISVQIIERFDSNSIEIWLMEYAGGNKGINYYFDNGLLATAEIDEMQLLKEGKLKPFLKLPRYLATNLFKSISEYNSNNGIKTKDENLIEGKLKATETNLSDLRDIVGKLFELMKK